MDVRGLETCGRALLETPQVPFLKLLLLDPDPVLFGDELARGLGVACGQHPEGQLAVGDDLVVEVVEIRDALIGKPDRVVLHLSCQCDQANRDPVAGLFKAVGHCGDLQRLLVQCRRAAQKSGPE